MLALNVGAMLISFLALIALLNAILGLAGLSLQQIFGWVVRADRVEHGRAVARRAGDWQPAGHAHGAERVRRLFAARPDEGEPRSAKSSPIATFALCGFANFASIGMQVGGIGALAPDSRRSDLARLGFRAMMAGTLANFVTATIAGFLL